MTTPDHRAIKGVRSYTHMLTFDPTYGAYHPRHPVTNLTNDNMARICRTADLSPRSTRWKATLSQDVGIGLGGLVRHTFWANDLVRVRCYLKAPLPVLGVDTATNRIAILAHGLSEGTSCTLWSTLTLPAGIEEGTVYYVRPVDANSLTLHATQADADAGIGPLPLTSAGAGAMELLPRLMLDTGWERVFPRVYEETVGWLDENFWSATYTPREIRAGRWTWPLIPERQTLTKCMTIEAQSGHPDGSVDLSMVSLSRGWRLGVNFDTGAETGAPSRAVMVESWSGAKEGELRPKRRTFSGECPFLDATESLEEALEDQATNDTVFPTLWVEQPANKRHWPRFCYLARNTELRPLRYSTQSGDKMGVAISLEEVL